MGTKDGRGGFHFRKIKYMHVSNKETSKRRPAMGSDSMEFTMHLREARMMATGASFNPYADARNFHTRSVSLEFHPRGARS